jgi:hypothetical protein
MKNFLTLLFLTFNLCSCKTVRRAVFNLSIAKNENLEILNDVICFVPSNEKDIDLRNNTLELAGIFKSEGFDVNNSSNANVIATLYESIEEKKGRTYDTVLDVSEQWVQNPQTQNLEVKPIYTRKKVERDYTYHITIVRVTFTRGKDIVVDAAMKVLSNEYNQNPVVYLQKLFKHIKAGQSIKNTSIHWYNEDSKRK